MTHLGQLWGDDHGWPGELWNVPSYCFPFWFFSLLVASSRNSLFLSAEPLKSLEKRAKTHKKKKQGKPQRRQSEKNKKKKRGKGKKEQGLEVRVGIKLKFRGVVFLALCPPPPPKKEMKMRLGSNTSSLSSELVLIQMQLAQPGPHRGHVTRKTTREFVLVSFKEHHKFHAHGTQRCHQRSGTSVWRPQSCYTVSRIECRIKFPQN